MTSVLNRTIFISHAAIDKDLANSFRDLVAGFFEPEVGVFLSSHPGDLPHGEDFDEHILQTLSRSDYCIVLLTPAATASAWVMFEIGFFACAKRLRDPPLESALSPLSYLPRGVPYPAPIAKSQVADGLSHLQISKLLDKILKTYDAFFDSEKQRSILKGLEAQAEDFVGRARIALEHAPVYKSEAIVEDLIARFDALISQGRVEEALSLKRMAEVTFAGPASSPHRDLLLDYRLHRRFADAYLMKAQFDNAKEQFSRLLRLAPRDIDSLRRLGLAALESKDEGTAKSVVEQIDFLDPDVIRESTELSGFRARVNAAEGKLREAVKILRECVGYEGKHWIVNNVAVYGMLAEGLNSQVLEDFASALALARNCEPGDEWALSTEVNALFALGRLSEAAEVLPRLRQKISDDSKWISATRYFDEILNSHPSSRVRSFDWRLASNSRPKRWRGWS